MLEFVIAVFLLELTPGPNMADLATLSLARGRGAGLIATVGVALGLSVHAIGTVFGAGTLIQQYPWLYETLRWTGGAYLLYLAWVGWWPAKENSPARVDLLSTAGSAVFTRIPVELIQPQSPFSSSFRFFPPLCGVRRATPPSRSTWRNSELFLWA